MTTTMFQIMSKAGSRWVSKWKK